MEVVIFLTITAVVAVAFFVVRRADKARPVVPSTPKAGSIRENANTAKK